MAARAVRGLSTPDLEQIRSALAGGRKPKVMFTEAAGQLVGQTGQIVELADPAAGSEWVMVRFGRDTLPFSPADLMIAPKGQPVRGGRAAAAARTSTAARATTAAPAAAPAPAAAVAPAVPAAPAGRVAPVAELSPDGPERRSAAGTDGPAAVDGSRPRSSAPVPTTERRAPAARRSGRTRAPATLTVTLSHASGNWTVAAQQGSRVLVRPSPVRAGEALKMVALLAVPAVHEAVEEIVASARAEAEREAERLRTELAEIETRLAELREAP